MITDFDKVYLRSVYLVLNHMQNRVKNYDIDTILDVLEIILEEQRLEENENDD